MSGDEVELLREDIANMERASAQLRVSLDRCAGLAGRATPSLDEQERLEALASRFARLADIAEQRGWVDDADRLIRIRQLRNTIAHDYAADDVAAVYVEIVALTPELLTIASRAATHAADLIRRRESRR